MDTGIQQFFYADSSHNFPLVKTRNFPGIPRNTGLWFDVVMAAPHSHEREIEGR
jgi:hypothetical protein